MRKLVFVAVSLILCGCDPAWAGKIHEEDAIKAIVGEAEDQGYRGMLAVACGIRNRGTLQGVYGFKSKRVRKGKVAPKYFEMARRAWLESAKKDIVNKGNLWENTQEFGQPSWAKRLKPVAKIGDHTFYYEK